VADSGRELALFRQEAIEAKSHRLHGDVILQQSLSSRAITAAILLVVGAAVAWVVTGSYARTETARGILAPVAGSSKIHALRPGVITDLLIKEGDQVKAGQKLAIIKIESPNAAGTLGTEEQLKSNAEQAGLAKQQIALSSRRSQSEVSRLDDIIAGLRAQTKTIEEQIKLQSDIVASVTRSYEQIAPVVEKGYVSRLEYERRHQAVLGERESLSRLQQQLIVTRTDIARSTKERERAMLDGQNEQASVQSNLQGLFQQRSKIEGDSSYAIVAPVSGRVTSLQASVGGTVAVAVPLMILIPDGAQLRADIFVPSRAIGFVRPGQEVRLLYDAFPYQRFGSFAARVETISRQAVAGQETNAPFKIDEPVYRVIVVPDRQQVNAYGQRVGLQPGMTLAANLVLERRSFLDWVLDPVRAVTNRT
jgi:membrane fusion protein